MNLFKLASIPFPHLDPVIFHAGPLVVKWYGLAYLLGFALAYWLLLRMSRAGIVRVNRAALSDLMGWLVLGVVLGGRIGWWIFYHRPGGVELWYEPLAIWHGGMSFHGGLIGVVLVILAWARAGRRPLWNIADAIALVAPIGLFFGRLANFVNAELVGRPTDQPWGVIFPGDTFARHPSQLYEAVLEGPLLAAALWCLHRFTKPRDSQVAALFLILYGLFRFAVEFTREPDPQLGFIAFGWLTMGQLLSIALTVAGLVMWGFSVSQPKQNPQTS